VAICITGMHRSGTSMVARLLNLCGLWLGADDEILGPAADNPEGFWEHVGVLTLDDDLLAALGGGWDMPPAPMPETWAARPELAPLLSRGAALVGAFRGHEPWGWKDPRSALVLPFWQTLAPDLRVVVCLRSPLAVAGSLRTRATASQAFSLGLWRTHHERLLDLPAGRCLVTHYDSYFHDPLAELRRVCAFAELTPSEETLAAAAAGIAPRLRHHEPSTLRTLDALPPDLAALYQRLCQEAGPVHAAARAHEHVGTASATRPDGEPPATSVLRERVAMLEATLAERDDRIAALEAARAADATELVRVNAVVTERDAVLAERDVALGGVRGELVTERRDHTRTMGQLSERTRLLEDAIRSVADTRSRLDAVTWERDEIVHSRAWRTMNRLWRLRTRLVPRGSRRERLLSLRPHARRT
jgi:hypothetical protein